MSKKDLLDDLMDLERALEACQKPQQQGLKDYLANKRKVRRLAESCRQGTATFCR